MHVLRDADRGQRGLEEDGFQMLVSPQTAAIRAFQAPDGHRKVEGS